MGDTDLITEEISSASSPVTVSGIYAADSREPFTLTVEDLTQTDGPDGQIASTFSS
jgi:hypothetical protein